MRFIVACIALLSICSLTYTYHSSQQKKTIVQNLGNQLCDAMKSGNEKRTSELVVLLRNNGVTLAWPSRNDMPYAFNLLRTIKDKPNDKEILSSYIVAGMPIQVMVTRGDTVMHLAASYNSDRVIKLLHARGINVNSKTDSGRTPLHFAVYHNTPQAAAQLIMLGADPHAKNDRDLSPYESIVEWNREDMRPAFEEAMRLKKIAFLPPTSPVGALHAPHAELHEPKLEPLSMSSSSPDEVEGSDIFA